MLQIFKYTCGFDDCTYSAPLLNVHGGTLPGRFVYRTTCTYGTKRRADKGSMYVHTLATEHTLYVQYVYAGWIYTDPVTGARVKGRKDSAVCHVFWLYSHSTQHEPRTHAPEPCIVCLVWVVYWRNWFDPSRRTKLLNCKSKGPGDID